MADIFLGGLDAFCIVGFDQPLVWPHRRNTAASFQARFSASCTPELAPRAPNGDT